MNSKAKSSGYVVSAELQRKLDEIHQIGLEGQEIISEIDDPAVLGELSDWLRDEIDKALDRPTLWQRICRLFR